MQTCSSNIPSGTPPLDAEALIDQVRRRHGVRLELLGAAPGGEVGAAFVRWPDGREGVLTRAGDDTARSGDELRRTADMLANVRARGVPVPRYDLIVPVTGAHVVIQERLPGHLPTVVSATLVSQMIEVIASWTELLAEQTDLEAPKLYLTESGPGFCRHESLANYDDRTRKLLGQVREIGRSVDTANGHDLVHLDYHLGNVLVDDQDTITGIIDWDGWGRGDRWFSLEVLAFDLAWRRADLVIRNHLDEIIAAAVPPETLLAYRASLALRQVDWSIRHHDGEHVDFWLAFAGQRLGSPGLS